MTHPAELPNAPRPNCHGTADPDLWFPVSEQRRLTEVQQALALCNRCPLVDACRDWAIEHRVIGIWGATTTVEREAARARRPAHGGRAASRRPVEPCPSEAAYRRHLRQGETCGLCRSHQQALKRARTARRAAALATAGAA